MADFVESKINAHKIVVFSKTWCPYCTLAKKVLTSVGAKFEVVDLDELPNGDAIMEALEAKTGRDTVPNVFVDKESIGGGSDVEALHKQGKLVPLLQAHAAL
ncbi:Aste57867_12398 [Aphanomyces stellatus]|uniref:Aste57867_12398 protein n=1 Tax=Aphanomyces stellatus TaxID=120398 RepID=A0A485KW29_9STRA|nr:hypothetical protein As57867_012352 [Aphanomyces stellatus]VFT89249.1 Aste57867_12398 [Aphanomyces stellatus]